MSSLLGNPLSVNEKYSIIGAGISGLLCGYFLKKAGVDFEILEKQHKAGGLLSSTKTTYGLVEHAANAYVNSPAMQSMLADIGLQAIKSNQKYKARFIFKDGDLKQIPFFILKDLFGSLAGLFKKGLPNPNPSLEDFVVYFAKPELLKYLIEPAMAGVYAAESKNLGAAALFPKLIAELKEGKHLAAALKASRNNQKSTAPKGSYSFNGGMQDLVNALEKHLAEHIRYNVKVQDLDVKNPTIICTPAYSAAKIFPDKKLSNLLQDIEYLPLTTVSMIFEEKDLLKFKKGFGCLIPRTGQFKSLGILFNHCIFENRVNGQGLANITCIIAGTQAAECSAEALKKLVYAELKSILGLQGAALDWNYRQYQHALPLYGVNLPANLLNIDTYLRSSFPNVRLFGNYTGKISIRGMCNEASQFFS